MKNKISNFNNSLNELKTSNFKKFEIRRKIIELYNFNFLSSVFNCWLDANICDIFLYPLKLENKFFNLFFVFVNIFLEKDSKELIKKYNFFSILSSKKIQSIPDYLDKSFNNLSNDDILDFYNNNYSSSNFEELIKNSEKFSQIKKVEMLFTMNSNVKTNDYFSHENFLKIFEKIIDIISIFLKKNNKNNLNLSFKKIRIIKLALKMFKTMKSNNFFNNFFWENALTILLTKSSENIDLFCIFFFQKKFNFKFSEKNLELFIKIFLEFLDKFPSEEYLTTKYYNFLDLFYLKNIFTENLKLFHSKNFNLFIEKAIENYITNENILKCFYSQINQNMKKSIKYNEINPFEKISVILSKKAFEFKNEKLFFAILSDFFQISAIDNYIEFFKCHLIIMNGKIILNNQNIKLFNYDEFFKDKEIDIFINCLPIDSEFNCQVDESVENSLEIIQNILNISKEKSEISKIGFIYYSLSYLNLLIDEIVNEVNKNNLYDENLFEK